MSGLLFLPLCAFYRIVNIFSHFSFHHRLRLCFFGFVHLLFSSIFLFDFSLDALCLSLVHCHFTSPLLSCCFAVLSDFFPSLRLILSQYVSLLSLCLLGPQLLFVNHLSLSLSLCLTLRLFRFCHARISLSFSFVVCSPRVAFCFFLHRLRLCFISFLFFFAVFSSFPSLSSPLFMTPISFSLLCLLFAVVSE